MPNRYLEKYFMAEGKGFRVKEETRKRVTFHQVNLVEPSQSYFLNDMDVIFCRNVIIYFNLDVKKKVIANFFDRLKAGGYLLLGHSESLSYVTPVFELKHFKKDMVYHKAAGLNG